MNSQPSITQRDERVWAALTFLGWSYLARRVAGDGKAPMILRALQRLYNEHAESVTQLSYYTGLNIPDRLSAKWSPEHIPVLQHLFVWVFDVSGSSIVSIMEAMPSGAGLETWFRTQLKPDVDRFWAGPNNDPAVFDRSLAKVSHEDLEAKAYKAGADFIETGKAVIKVPEAEEPKESAPVDESKKKTPRKIVIPDEEAIQVTGERSRMGFWGWGAVIGGGALVAGGVYYLYFRKRYA